MEPDRRFGGTQADRSSPTVLFRSEGYSPSSEQSNAYQSARTLVEVGILAAAADGNVTDEEFHSLERFIAGATTATATELLRLHAYGLALRQDLPKQQSVWKKLSALELPARRQIAQLGACNLILQRVDRR